MNCPKNSKQKKRDITIHTYYRIPFIRRARTRKPGDGDQNSGYLWNWERASRSLVGADYILVGVLFSYTHVHACTPNT